MVSRFTRSVPVTINDVLDGHVALDLQCLDRLYLHGYLAQLQVGGQVIQFLQPPRVPGPVPGVPAADRGRLPPPGRLLRRGQPHPGGDAEGRRPQHRGDAAVPEQGRSHRPVAGRGDRGGPGNAAGADLPPASHRPGQVPAVLLRQEGPPGHGLLLLPVGRELRPGVHQGLHLLPLADEDLGQRPRVGQAAGPQDRVRLHRAVQRVRLGQDPAVLQRICDALQPGTISVFFQRWLSRLPLPLGAADQRSRVLVGAVDGPGRGVPHHRVHPAPPCPGVLRGAGHRQPRPRPPGHRRDHLRPADHQRQAARHRRDVQDQGHHPGHRGHHQRLLPPLPDQAVPQRRPRAAHRDRHQLTHRPADRPPPAQPGRTPGRRACDQHPAAAH